MQVVVQEILNLHPCCLLLCHEIFELITHVRSEGAVGLQKISLIHLIVLLAASGKAIQRRQWRCAAKVHKVIVRVDTGVSHMNMHADDRGFCSSELCCTTKV